MPCRTRRAISLASLLVAVGSVALYARVWQDSSSTSRLRLVRIDAVVTDPRGHAIDDLGASDFVVLENGTSRPIRSAEFRGIPRHGPVAVLPIITGFDEQRAAAESGTRVFAFFLDDFHVSPGANAARVRDAVASFVDEKLFARDLATVVTPLDSMDSVRFSRDRALLHGPIRNFSGRKGDLSPRTAFEEKHIGRDADRVRAARQRLSYDRLRELAVRLGYLKAERAVIVLMTEGSGADAAGSDVSGSELEAVARAASRFHLTIYTFDPSAPDEQRPIANRERSGTILTRLATDTGGLTVRADAFIAGFARVYHDTEAYYALAFEPLSDDDAFHRIELRGRQRDVQVRTHAGYWSTTQGLWRTMVARPSPIPSEARRPLRRSPLIDVWSGVRRVPNRDLEVVVVWEPRGGSGATANRVLLSARNQSGATVFEGQLAAVGTAKQAERDRARFSVKPGPVAIDMSVLSADGILLDADASRIDVPDLHPSAQSGPVLLSTEIIRRRTLLEFRTASVDPEATPSAALTFGRRDQLLIRVTAFDPTGIPVGVSANVLNRAGRPVRELATLEYPREGSFTQFALPLSWLPPDAYQIEVVGTNVNGRVRERVGFRLGN